MKSTLACLCAFAAFASSASAAQRAADPSPLLGVAFSSPKVTAGDNVKLRIRLTGRAPAGGLLVALKATGSALRLPHTVTIPRGASSMILTVHIANAAKPQTARVEASELVAASKDSLSLSHRSYSTLIIVGSPAVDGGAR